MSFLTFGAHLVVMTQSITAVSLHTTFCPSVVLGAFHWKGHKGAGPNWHLKLLHLGRICSHVFPHNPSLSPFLVFKKKKNFVTLNSHKHSQLSVMFSLVCEQPWFKCCPERRKNIIFVCVFQNSLSISFFNSVTLETVCFAQTLILKSVTFNFSCESEEDLVSMNKCVCVCVYMLYVTLTGSSNHLLCTPARIFSEGWH